MNLVQFHTAFDPFRDFERVAANAYAPAYDLAKTGDAAFEVTLAVPGYTQDELKITAENGILTVTGESKPAAPAEGVTVLRRGIARGKFERRFTLADHVEVKGAILQNGILRVALAREVPEALKPKTIAIATPAAALPQAA